MLGTPYGEMLISKAPRVKSNVKGHKRTGDYLTRI